jgi:hypothetical protein
MLAFRILHREFMPSWPFKRKDCMLAQFNANRLLPPRKK